METGSPVGFSASGLKSLFSQGFLAIRPCPETCCGTRSQPAAKPVRLRIGQRFGSAFLKSNGQVDFIDGKQRSCSSLRLLWPSPFRWLRRRRAADRPNIFLIYADDLGLGDVGCDGGTRVPFIVRWPARVKPGESPALVCQIDLMASFAALTGQSPGPGEAPDSVNVLPALLGGSAVGRSELVEQAATLALRQGLLKFIEPAKGARVLKNTGSETGLG